MKIILHGDDLATSRKRLLEIISREEEKGLETLTVDGAKITIAEILTVARSQGFFAQDKLLVIENLFSKNKSASKIAAELAKTDAHFCLWEEKLISRTKLKSLGSDLQIEEYKIPFLVFKFLDAFVPGEEKALLGFLHQILANKDAEFLLLMLAARVRQLIWAKADPETLALPDWQKARLLKQAQRWKIEDLYALHAKLLNLDRLNKRSGLPEDLAASLDLLLLGA